MTVKKGGLIGGDKNNEPNQTPAPTADNKASSQAGNEVERFVTNCIKFFEAKVPPEQRNGGDPYTAQAPVIPRGTEPNKENQR